ncbi:hypothetical protein [Pseudomonas sp. Hp2]|uniref:hypothetical protein n=1 Tax=Pseudomonas sp. Hp2 TaxID=701189 RepID=UPI0015AC8CE9|nr:hypothetical protein [Pseudomonas sp. Hp2]
MSEAIPINSAIKHKARSDAGLVVFAVVPLTLLRLSQHGIKHLRDGALLGLGQAADLFELLLQLRRRPALARAALGGLPDQFLDADAERGRTRGSCLRAVPMARCWTWGMRTTAAATWQASRTI